MGISRLLPPGMADRIEEILAHLHHKAQAKLVILADVSGQLISQRGATGSFDPELFSALAAGNVAATAEMARRLGEEKQFKNLLQEGEKHNTYISLVADSFLLVVVFDTRIQIGLVRLFAKEAIKSLLPMATEFETFMANEGAPIALGFRDALADAMDSAFNWENVAQPEAGQLPTTGGELGTVSGLDEIDAKGGS